MAEARQQDRNDKTPLWKSARGRRWGAAGLSSLGLLLSLAAASVVRGAGARPSNSVRPAQAPALIPLTSAAGQALLTRAGTLRADEPSLAQWFETQANLAFCGAASAVMVLNSLGQPAPQAAGYGSYRFWTQTNLFEATASQRFVNAAVVAREGMTLEQLDGLLASQGLRVNRYHGDRLTLPQLRLLLRLNLADPGDRLLANYDRSALGQKGGGHISPLAAYDPRKDRVLILDVARYRYPAVWVSTEALWAALRTVDRSSGLSRGLVSAARAVP
ncbi:hypothetical protein LBMAG41_03610 [Cyanobium sp.]|nr:hypothetical protein LBMAG41_03610 [Cyanobium sp.]